jgi:phosphotriesterase-related protein
MARVSDSSGGSRDDGISRRTLLKGTFAGGLFGLVAGGRVGTPDQALPAGDTMVQTVRGPIPSGTLGTTLMHEHVFVLDPDVMQNYPADWGNEEKRIADAVARLNQLKSKGVDTIVDLTVIGLGRNISRIQRIAERTQIQIVVAAGVYTYRDLPFSFRFRGPGTATGGPEFMADMFVRDIVEGIDGTAIKAGVLKCATDAPGVTPDVERVLRAVAQAHRRTGVPISTHTNAARRVGLDQQRIFREEGVNLSRVVIGHSGDTTNLQYLEELIGNGSFIGMDRFGLDSFLPFEERVNTVAEMCRRGHAASMVLSQDASCYIDWFPEQFVAKTWPRWNYVHISNDVIPALKKRGVADEHLHAMLVENPRRILQPIASY